MKKILITCLTIFVMITIVACGEGTEENNQQTSAENEQENQQSSDNTQQEETVPEFTEESAVQLMNAYKEELVSLFNESSENGGKIVSYDSMEEITEQLKSIMSTELAEDTTNSFFSKKEDGIYVIPRDAPTWLEEGQSFKIEEVTEKHVQIVQERQNELIGHVVMEYHVKYLDNQWMLTEIESEQITVPDETEEEEKATDQPQEKQDDIETVAQTVLTMIANKNMEDLADMVDPNKGLLFSPYVYVEEDALVFEQDEVASFLEDEKVYEWGVYDGRGNPIELTPSEYYEKFIYSEHLMEADQILVNEFKQRGNTLNNINEVFPNATVVEFHHEGSEEYAGIDWVSLNLVFEENKNGTWKLVAIVHDEWTI